MSDLVARLRKELPTVTERESVWCSVQGYDLREAVILLESLSAQVVQLTDDRDSWEQQASARVDDALAFARRAEAAEAQVVQLRGALAELVAVEDLKEFIEKRRAQRFSHVGWFKQEVADYDRRKPLAWAAARAALQGQQGEPK